MRTYKLYFGLTLITLFGQRQAGMQQLPAASRRVS
jgi:hypothetical protein